MVVHDMRGPVTSMKIAMQQTIEIISSYQHTILLYKDVQNIQAEIEQIWSSVTTDTSFLELIEETINDLLIFKAANQTREEAKNDCDKKHDEISDLTSMIQEKVNLLVLEEIDLGVPLLNEDPAELEE